MQVVIIFFTSLVIGIAVRLLVRRQRPKFAELAISAASTVLTLGFGSLVESTGSEYSMGIALFLAATLTIALGAVSHRPLFR